MPDSSAPRRVEVKRKTLERYRPLIGDDAVDEIRDLAREVRGMKVLELSSTAVGGGVAELLGSLVSLERDVGLDADWQVIAGSPQFFEITKKMHNGMQGMDVSLSDEEREAYLRHGEHQAEHLSNGWDTVIVHDPQPAAIRSFRPDASGRWVWRCHIDSSEPNAAVWDLLRPLCEQHDEAVFTLDEFVPEDLDIPSTVILPAIDPLASKNRLLPDYLARETAEELGIDLTRPLLLQVSRFDPWKDPLGVVRVWQQAKASFEGLQLALVGAMADDDPEGWKIYEEVETASEGHPDCHLLTNQMGVANHEVNALQRVADVAIQKSTREGFGLIVAETLWKGTAMVAGGVGGIPTQIEDGVSGYLAGSDDEFAGRVVELLENPNRALELGAEGMRRVRDDFLIPRLLRDQLRVLAGAREPAST